MYNISRKNVDFNIKNDNPQEIYFKSPFSSGNKEVDRARALLFAPDNEDAIVFIHGFGGNDKFNRLRYYVHYFSDNNYTVLMPVLPFLVDRRPEDKEGNIFLSGFTEDIEKRFYQAVTDIFTCVDYLESAGYKRIYIMGYSFGGLISTIAMALDERIEKGILVVTGGNFEYITWKSFATKVLRVRYEEEENCNSKKCHELHKDFDKVCANFQGLEQLEDLPSCFRYDPSLFANLINAEDVIMFNALFDILISRKSSDDLWEKLGCPERHKLFAGHFTTHLFFKKFICNKVIEFLQKN